MLAPDKNDVKGAVVRAASVARCVCLPRAEHDAVARAGRDVDYPPRRGGRGILVATGDKSHQGEGERPARSCGHDRFLSRYVVALILRGGRRPPHLSQSTVLEQTHRETGVNLSSRKPSGPARPDDRPEPGADRQPW